MSSVPFFGALGFAGAALRTLQVGLAALTRLALGLGDRKRAAAHVYGFIELIFCHVSLYCTPACYAGHVRCPAACPFSFY